MLLKVTKRLHSLIIPFQFADILERQIEIATGVRIATSDTAKNINRFETDVALGTRSKQFKKLPQLGT